MPLEILPLTQRQRSEERHPSRTEKLSETGDGRQADQQNLHIGKYVCGHAEHTPPLTIWTTAGADAAACEIVVPPVRALIHRTVIERRDVVTHTAIDNEVATAAYPEMRCGAARAT